MAKIKTRARAVDMLGRQQIATIQNALSEVFKNAHDAYAVKVQADYFENNGSSGEGFLLIRDNGVGMTRTDFENKWLVLGTESKLGNESKKHFCPPGMKSRAITGEKGIGRLAIAILGRQVLILTRAQRKEGLHELVVCWVHWGLFEIPGLNLEDIEIPIETFPGGTLPTKEQIRQLKKKLIENVNAILKSDHKKAFENILQEIEKFNPDPAGFDQFFAGKDETPLSLAENSCGTHFLIGTANPIIQAELRAEDKVGDYSFRKQLLGFYNNVFNRTKPAPLRVSFQRWPAGSPVGEEYLNEETFFRTEELSECSDHYLHGKVDSFGQFNGELRVYDKEYSNLVIPWPENCGRKTECGEFQVLFGYLQGHQKDSIVDPEKWTEMNNKLDYLGGIYVYMDNIRILPYGDHSFDWLEVEKRRNKGSGYYFFSFRRMFGAVLLSREKNGALAEKAGREGFQANRAYRELREILIGILNHLAANFFRKGGLYTESFEQAKNEAIKRSKALEKQQKAANIKRKAFAKELQDFHNKINSKQPEVQLKELRKKSEILLEGLEKIQASEIKAVRLLEVENKILSEFHALKSEYKLKKPSGFAFTKSLNYEWEAYITENIRLEEEQFSPFAQKLSRRINDFSCRENINIDQHKRLSEKITTIADKASFSLKEVSKNLNNNVRKVKTIVSEAAKKALFEANETVKSILAEMNRQPLQEMDSDELEKMQSEWEKRVIAVETQNMERLSIAQSLLASFAENMQAANEEMPLNLMTAVEEKMLALEEQAEQDFEMAQLGMAVAIINHEFVAAIKQVRRSISGLGQISRQAKSLRPLYESIKDNFEHLDGHLNLFTPLQRRLYRKSILISGKSLRNYINKLFSSRLERHKIKLNCSEHFLSAEMNCYPSTIYPPLINLIDNAIYWLSAASGERKIILDATHEALIIANNGPELEYRYSQQIFERGFSMKSGGRGLGLFISRQALRSEKMDLIVEKPPVDYKVAFHIRIPDLNLKSQSL
jgi:signal transduction histidine kinase